MDRVFATVLTCAVITCTLVFIILIGENNRLRSEAIERTYALYCPQNGVFAWKGECGD